VSEQQRTCNTASWASAEQKKQACQICTTSKWRFNFKLHLFYYTAISWWAMCIILIHILKCSYMVEYVLSSLYFVWYQHSLIFDRIVWLMLTFSWMIYAMNMRQRTSILNPTNIAFYFILCVISFICFLLAVFCAILTYSYKLCSTYHDDAIWIETFWVLACNVEL